MRSFPRPRPCLIHRGMTPRRIHAGPGLQPRPPRRDVASRSSPSHTPSPDGVDREALRRQWAEAMKRIQARIRAKGYSPRTEEAYLGWARRFLRWAGPRPPDGLGVEEVRRYLRHLGEERFLSPKTVHTYRSRLREKLRQR